MIAGETWDMYNTLGLLDIIEHHDQSPTIVRSRAGFRVQYRTDEGIAQRDVIYDEDNGAYYHLVDEDFLV